MERMLEMLKYVMTVTTLVDSPFVGMVMLTGYEPE
jgi:hypothetical protein